MAISKRANPHAVVVKGVQGRLASAAGGGDRQCLEAGFVGGADRFSPPVGVDRGIAERACDLFQVGFAVDQGRSLVPGDLDLDVNAVRSAWGKVGRKRGGSVG
jgi:hypothetical protein